MPRGHKVVFVGDSGVGKTTLIHRMTKSVFIESPNSTIGAAFQIINHCGTRLSVWDMAGQQRFNSLRPMYIRGSLVVVYCFDERMSPETLALERSQILQIDRHVHIVYVMTKCDDVYSEYKIKPITKNEDEKIFYTSSKTGRGVGELLDYLATYTRGNATIDPDILEIGFADRNYATGDGTKCSSHWCSC